MLARVVSLLYLFKFKLIQPMLSRPVSEIRLILSFHLYLCLANGLLPSTFPNKLYSTVCAACSRMLNKYEVRFILIQRQTVVTFHYHSRGIMQEQTKTSKGRGCRADPVGKRLLRSSRCLPQLSSAGQLRNHLPVNHAQFCLYSASYKVCCVLTKEN